MTRTTEDVVPPGTLRAGTQPALQASPELVLRPWSGSDKDAVLEAFSARDIQYWHLRSVASEREVDAWLDERRRSWSSEQGASWAVVDSDDRVLGQVALRGLNLAMGVTQVSYWVLPDARGGDVATAAVRALSDWSLDEVGLHRVWLMHSVRNDPSCRVASRSGHEAEGTLREALLHTDGWHDMHVHGRVAGRSGH